MPTGFHHITLNVTDLDRSRAFYEGILGLPVDQDFPGEKLRLRIGDHDRLVLRPSLPEPRRAITSPNGVSAWTTWPWASRAGPRRSG